MKTLSIILDLLLSDDALTQLQLEAKGLGITNGQAASAVLEQTFRTGAFMDDERVLLMVEKVRSLYPDPARPDLEGVESDYRKAIEATKAEAQASLEEARVGHVMLKLPPAMATFLREIERVFPKLWSIFAGECVEAVLDELEHYIDNAYSFPSPQDRMEAFRQVREARQKYRQASDGQHGSVSR